MLKRIKSYLARRRRAAIWAEDFEQELLGYSDKNPEQAMNDRISFARFIENAERNLKEGKQCLKL